MSEISYLMSPHNLTTEVGNVRNEKLYFALQKIDLLIDHTEKGNSIIQMKP